MAPPCTWLLAGILALSCCSMAAVTNKLSSQDQPLPAEYEDIGSNPGGEEVDDPQVYQGLTGRAGIDFPMLRRIPKTSFSCRNVKSPGYFADLETQCQVFHLCDGGRKMSFLCPNGTIFRQSKLTCDWWFKVDCKTSEEFYESSAEQLRLDRAGPIKAQDDRDVTTLRPIRDQNGRDVTTINPIRGQNDREVTTIRPKSQDRDVTTTFRPFIGRDRDITTNQPIRVQNNDVTTTLRPIRNKDEDITTTFRPIRVQSQWQDTNSLRKEETQEFAETGSFIIPRRRNDVTSRSLIKEVVDPVTTQAAVTSRSSRARQEVTTTTREEVTSSPVTTTTGFTENESLQVSQSAWYTETPSGGQENYNQVTFYNTPETTLLPPTTTPQELLAAAQTASYIGRSVTDPSHGSHTGYPVTDTSSFNTDNPQVSFTGFTTTDSAVNTDRSVTDLAENSVMDQGMRGSRGFVSSPRPGLNEVPLSASPQALHSLARYFAADNQTRLELEKAVPAGTMELMAALMPHQTTAASLDTLSPDLRQLAQIFSKALSDYLHDPATFKASLNAHRPTDPPPTQNLVDEDDKDEVLDYSDNFNTKKPKTTTTTELPETTTFTTDRPIKNEVASIVNEILQDPEDITGRKIPSEVIPLIKEETQYRYPVTSRDINLLTYTPSESVYSSTTTRPLDNNFVESIPTSTSFPITPEPIPMIPADELPYPVPDYVEIGYQKPKYSPTTPRNYYANDPINFGPNYAEFQPPSLDTVLSHFAPHDLNSLAIFSVHTNPSPNPVSVAVHLPTQSTSVRHHVTVLTSSHSEPKSKVTTYRPMISKLLFPLPTVQNIQNDVESLQSANTASFPASFRNAQSILQNTKEKLVKSWLTEEKSLSQIITETIPTTYSPATTLEPVTETIPQETTTYGATSEVPEEVPRARNVPVEVPRARKVDEEVPRARKVDGGGSKLVLLLVKNGERTTQNEEQISRTKLLEALLLANKTSSAEVEDPTTPSLNVTSPPLTVTTPGRRKQPEITTYRSAHHQQILTRARESAEEGQIEVTREELPRPAALVLSQPQSQTVVEPLTSKLPPLVTNSTHSDSRAFNILKSLYSLASRWG